MRAALIILLLLGPIACTSMLVGGSGSSAGRPIGHDGRSSDTLASDRQISALIRGRYAADADLGRAALVVDTREGVVTLKGELDGFGLRDRAVRLARDVSGVVRVHNRITVRSR